MCSSGLEQSEHIFITHMRAADLACSLRRLPAGFYIAVEFDGISATTSNKTVSINKDVAEWDDEMIEILLPPTRQSVISFQVYASFEQGPRLGSGELLGRCEISVEEVLDCSVRLEPIRFIASWDERLTSCPSLRVVAKRRRCDGSECKVRPELPKSATKSEVEELTDEGHHALLCYRRGQCQDQAHLCRAIQCFERARDNCPIDYPNRSAALFNLANARFIHCLAHNYHLDLDVSIALYRDVLRLRTTGHPDHAMTALELGFALLTRFQRRGDKTDKTEAIDLLHRVVELAPADSHIHRAGRLTLQMADASVSLQTKDPKTPDDMDNVRLIDGKRVMLRASSRWDPRHHVHLAQLGSLLCRRFEERGDLVDIHEAVSMLDGAVELLPNGHADKLDYLNDLGKSLRLRFERLGNATDMERSIFILEEALSLAPDSHSDKPNLLNSLGSSLLSRFERFGDVADIMRSVSVFEEAVCLTPDGHPCKQGRLSKLGNSLSRRFQCIGDVADLTKSVSMFEEAIRLTPEGHPDKPRLLNSLGISSARCFERLGDVADITKSVSAFQEAVDLVPDDDPDMPSRLNNLGSWLSRRFQHLGDAEDIAKSISTFEKAVRLTPDSHPGKPWLLDSLGTSLSYRFELLDDVTDMMKSVSMFEEAVRLTPDGHPNKLCWLINLGSWLYRRFQRLGDVADITKSISVLEEAVRLTPDSHPGKPGPLSSLGNSLLRRFERLGDVANITKSIWAIEEADRLCPDGHPGKPRLLSNLGNSLLRRFERLGDVADIAKSVLMHEEAVRLTPDSHPDKPSWLNNLGRSLSCRFQRLGEVADIAKSVSMQEEAVRLTPDGNANKPSWLTNLGNSLLNRFERFGDAVDIMKSVSMKEEAVRLTPDGHPDKPGWLGNLGLSLSRRFEYLGDVTDITKSVFVQEEAIRLTPDGHPDKPRLLSSLGHSLSCRFQRLGDATDITKSVSAFEEAVRLTTEDHPDKPSRLNNLANSLLSRSKCHGDVADMTRSVLMHEEAVRLTPDGHPDKPSRLNNLGSSLFCRFQHIGEVADMTKSVSVFEEAIHLIPDGHPDKPAYLCNLGISFIDRYNHFRDPLYLSIAASHFSSASRCPIGLTFIRLKAARHWIWSAQGDANSETLLDAYTTALGLLPQLAWMGLPLTERHRVLIDAADIAREAAAAALEAGHPDMAVEWLEQGRSVVWNQLLQLRSPVDLLRASHPDLADAKFEQTSKQLERASSRGQLPSDNVQSNRNSNSRSLEDEVQTHHTLALKREKLLAHIRSLPGFDRFLLPKTIEQLTAMATLGPVVYLNAGKQRCDAFIVSAQSGCVIPVPLSGVTYRHVEAMSRIMLNRSWALLSEDDMSLLISSCQRNAINDAIEDREGFPEGFESQITVDRFQLVLGFLWLRVVHPVLQALGFSTPSSPIEKLPRIFWCPTGPFAFLPIHAAGLYRTWAQPGAMLSDFAISSYIPTLSALALSSGIDTSHRPSNIRLLTVPQPLSDGSESRLTNVSTEIDHIHRLSQATSRVTLQDSDDPIHPLDSGLCLADRRRLKLSDIIQLSRPHGGLAFLSACQTAKGDEKLSEESVHLAAGMLLAGYGGVIATMWSIMDKDAPKVARDVYQHLFVDSKVPNTTEAAEALHRAVVRLRDEDKVPFSSWVPFIHFGR